MKYTLPDLPYDYGALQPYISAETLLVHHRQVHATYVGSANYVIERLETARERNDFARIPALERVLAFNIAGHVLHSLFWRNLSPQGGGRPPREFAQRIEKDFGSFELFKRQMIRTASTILGSGWAALAWDPVGARLVTLQIHDHSQSDSAQDNILLMVLDAWEHAYYLQYRAEKGDFFEAVWQLWDWQDIAARYHAARNRETPRRVSQDGARYNPAL